MGGSPCCHAALRTAAVLSNSRVTSVCCNMLLCCYAAHAPCPAASDRLVALAQRQCLESASLLLSQLLSVLLVFYRVGGCCTVQLSDSTPSSAPVS
jgi:hypothetical protein